MDDKDLAQPTQLEIKSAKSGGYALLTLRLPGMLRAQTLRLDPLQAHNLAFDALMAASSIEIPHGLDGQRRSMQRSAQWECSIAPFGPWDEATAGLLQIGHFRTHVALDPPDEEWPVEDLP
jgi:hypothetical protein